MADLHQQHIERHLRQIDETVEMGLKADRIMIRMLE